MIDRVGQQLGNYRILRLLGRGGFADVYLGEHIHLHKPAALKILRMRLGEQESEQFLREAQTLAWLEHPHIVRVLDFAVQDGQPFLVMDYAVGGTLRTKHPAGTRLPLEQVLVYVEQVASALQFAHDQHIMHRDVKPENMLLNAREEVLLADFGLARLVPIHQASTQSLNPTLAGTTPYLAPEQVHGQPVPASDQYALGVVVYEWLCGQRPFRGTPVEVAIQHISTPPPSFHEQLPELSPAVEEVVLRALAKEPEERFPSVQYFAIALRHATRHMEYRSVAPAELVSSTGAAPSVEPFWKVPTVLTPLVGREQDVAAVCALLSRPDVRLLTLLGVGGIGKTRLAIQVASQLRERFKDGVCFVGLAPISDPSLVLTSIAHEFGLQEAGAQPLVETVKAWLRDKHFLLLLDNFEQIASAAPLLEDLLSACPQLVILVTSREVLRLPAEHLFPVPSLTFPDLATLTEQEDLAQYAAVSLFLLRTQAIRPDFQLTPTNAQTIAEICVRLDGLPLAIELAAARIRVLPPQALLTRLAQRFQVLTGGSRTLPLRQQTLRNTIKWSYDLLNEQEQQLFRCLSIFVGGCTLQAAEAVCGRSSDAAVGMEGELLDGVASLIDKSLLHQSEQEGEELRLTMLETIREFGMECLEREGELESARRAHANYYLAQVEAAEPLLIGSEQILWFDRLERDLDNLRAILQAAEVGEVEEREEALRLGAALRLFWLGRGYFHEGRSFLEQLLASTQVVDASVRLRALNALGVILWTQKDTRGLEPVADEILTLARKQGDQLQMTVALILRGAAMMQERRDYAQAQVCLEEALSKARAIGDRLILVWALASLGRLALYQQDAPWAIARLEEGLALCRVMGEKVGMSALLLLLAQAELSEGQTARARTLLEESLTLYQALGNTWGIAQAYSLLGRLAIQQGELGQAKAFLTESAQMASEIGDRHSIARSRLLLAGLATLQGEFGTAREWYEEGISTAMGIKHTNFIASGLKGLGCVAAAQGLHTWACILWGAAEPLREARSVSIPQSLYDPMVNLARSQMGEAAFTASWAQGRTMTPKQALAAQGMTEMLRSAPIEPPSIPPGKTTPANPSGLTAREVEVLRLVAQGLSDAKVAEQLAISPRTVNGHLTSIYSKIRVSSRTAATRYAIEQRLV